MYCMKCGKPTDNHGLCDDCIAETLQAKKSFKKTLVIITVFFILLAAIIMIVFMPKGEKAEPVKSGTSLTGNTQTFEKEFVCTKETIYDSKGDLYEHYEYKYDQKWNVLEKRTYRFDFRNLCSIFTYEYNEDGLLTKEAKTYYEMESANAEPIPYDSYVTEYMYDLLGHKTETLEYTNGRLSYVYKYDKYGNITNQLSYDANGNVTHEWDNEYRYDSDGNEVFVLTLRYGKQFTTTSCEYNAEGQLIKKTYRYADEANNSPDTYTPEDKITEFEYDREGRIVKFINYDGNGKLVSIEERVFDANDRVAKHTFYNSDGTVSFWSETTYDSNGAPIKSRSENIKNGTGITTTEYEYDELGRCLGSVDIKSNGEIIPNHSYSYDENDNVIKKCDYSLDGELSSCTTYEYERTSVYD